jgi:hypothetical protein
MNAKSDYTETEMRELTLEGLARIVKVVSEPDPNQLAARIVRESTKNPAAVSLGRLGGLKGGKARAEKLSPERRREIASKAAKKRWAKQNGAKETLDDLKSRAAEKQPRLDSMLSEVNELKRTANTLSKVLGADPVF